MAQYLKCIIFFHGKKYPNPQEWEPKILDQGDCLRQTQVWCRHKARVGLTSVEQVTESRSRERMAQVWPLTSREVITRTLSSVVILYLNLNPSCLSFDGPDSFMKVVTPWGNNRNKVIGLSNKIVSVFVKLREYNMLIWMKCLVLIHRIKYLSLLLSWCVLVTTGLLFYFLNVQDFQDLLAKMK